MMPGILRRTAQPFWPLALVHVTKAVTRRHDKTMVQLTLMSIRLLAFAVKLDPADQSLIAQRNKLAIGADRFLSLADDKLPLFAKLDH
jgi:hypothetical protein